MNIHIRHLYRRLRPDIYTNRWCRVYAGFTDYRLWDTIQEYKGDIRNPYVVG